MNLVRRAYCSDARQPENKMKLIFISYKTKINSEPEISHRFEKDNIKLFNASKLFFDNKNAIFWKKSIISNSDRNVGKNFFYKISLETTCIHWIMFAFIERHDHGLSQAQNHMNQRYPDHLRPNKHDFGRSSTST